MKDRKYTDDPRAWEALANAIITRAAEDYRLALESIKKTRGKGAIADALAIERFFASDWYGQLTDMDGSYIINRIRQEVAGERRPA